MNCIFSDSGVPEIFVIYKIISYWVQTPIFLSIAYWICYVYCPIRRSA